VSHVEPLRLACEPLQLWGWLCQQQSNARLRWLHGAPGLRPYLPHLRLHPLFEMVLDRLEAIADSPYRIDSMAFILETRSGAWASHPPIKFKGRSKKKRTFGEVVFKFADSAEGRFAGLLPEQGGESVRSVTLH
jgi:hypothetical protein